MTPSRGRSESISSAPRGYGGSTPVAFASGELIVEPMDAPRSGDSISVTVRFRPMRYCCVISESFRSDLWGLKLN